MRNTDKNGIYTSNSCGQSLKIKEENIYNAIKNRDSKMARKSMQYHFKDLMDTLHNMSEQKALDEAKNKALNIRKRFNITDHT